MTIHPQDHPTSWPDIELRCQCGSDVTVPVSVAHLDTFQCYHCGAFIELDNLAGTNPVLAEVRQRLNDPIETLLRRIGKVRQELGEPFTGKCFGCGTDTTLRLAGAPCCPDCNPTIKATDDPPPHAYMALAETLMGRWYCGGEFGADEMPPDDFAAKVRDLALTLQGAAEDWQRGAK